MDRSIFINIACSPVCNSFMTAKSDLLCEKIGNDIYNWLIYYLSTISKLYDIVPRAIKTRTSVKRSIARTNKKNQCIGIRSFMLLERNKNLSLPLPAKNSNFDALFCRAKISAILSHQGGDAYD